MTPDTPTKDDMKTLIKLKPGCGYDNKASAPIIALVGTGRNAYLWVGNDAPGDGWCFATISGTGRLRNLAKQILKATPSKKP